MRNWLIIILWLALWAAGCGPETETVPFSAQEQRFVLEGPLFSGPNPAQVTYEPELSGVLDGGYVDEAKLTEATFRLPDGQTFGEAQIQGIVLQLVADEADMVQVAVVNPVPTDQNQVSLTLSDEAQLGEIFKQSPIYLVADFDLSEDLDTTLTVIGNFDFQLAVAK